MLLTFHCQIVYNYFKNYNKNNIKFVCYEYHTRIKFVNKYKGEILMDLKSTAHNKRQFI